jgi:3-methyladenine DNA glycosylase AlkC
MAKALKDYFDRAMVEGIAADLKRAYPKLDAGRFVADCMKGFGPLALTARGAKVATVMQAHLPDDFAVTAAILIRALGPKLEATEGYGMAIFRYLPWAVYCGRHGPDDFEAGMKLVYEITQRFTSEGCVRPFLERHPERAFARLAEWASDPSVHVRRLVSEGTRPRLPWHSRLRAIEADPEPAIALLEMLKDDPERYVQRSVANNLNDIAKNHPERVLAILQRWKKGAPPGRRYVIQHALRTLIKAGHPEALAIIGIADAAKVAIDEIAIAPARLSLGDRARIDFTIASRAKEPQELLVDYAVHYVKANGEARKKVFKHSRFHLGPKEARAIGFTISFVDLTTRKHHPGEHRVEALINGRAHPLGAISVRRG